MTSLNAQSQKLRDAIRNGQEVVTRRSEALGQLIFCEGCCCGRTDRGFPPWPKDQIKARWKELRLNDTIQLTISGCLGPCDVANVVFFLPASGPGTWFGGLSELTHYESLIAWAESCQAETRLLPLPDELIPFQFQRFAGAVTQNA